MLFGEHTYFLDSTGLTIVEPVRGDGAPLGLVVNIASWTDAISPELRPLLKGMERADSIAFDLHKWM